ncbi:alpha/beta hydrolase fold domain-containing protein, partial [Pyxidicoccus sp. 3LG]
FFGGNGPGYLAEARGVLESLDAGRGLGLAAVAPPGFDGSPGKPSPEALQAGARAAVRWLVSAHGVRPASLQLVGFSMGSQAALAAAQALKQDGTPAKGLVLMAPFTEMDVTDPGLWGRLRTPDRYDNLSLAAPGLPPVRVLHGLADGALPPSHGEELARRLGGSFQGFPGVGHSELLKHPAALAEARAQLEAIGETE